MNILTSTEIGECLTGGPRAVARAIEAAVIRKLAAGVSVEPAYYWEPDGTIEWMKDGSGFSTNTGPAHGWKITHYYTAEQLASARVQGIKDCEEAVFNASGIADRKDCLDAIRALIGAKT